MHVQYQNLIDIAMHEFDDVISSTDFIGGTLSDPNKLRLYLYDTSFMDIWLSMDGDYAYHWERRRQTGEIFRWDNAPHYPKLSTYPDHFHKGDENSVVESHLSGTSESAFREILNFIRAHIKNK